MSGNSGCAQVLTYSLTVMSTKLYDKIIASTFSLYQQRRRGMLMPGSRFEWSWPVDQEAIPEHTSTLHLDRQPPVHQYRQRQPHPRQRLPISTLLESHHSTSSALTIAEKKMSLAPWLQAEFLDTFWLTHLHMACGNICGQDRFSGYANHLQLHLYPFIWIIVFLQIISIISYHVTVGGTPCTRVPIPCNSHCLIWAVAKVNLGHSQEKHFNMWQQAYQWYQNHHPKLGYHPGRTKPYPW